VGLEEDPRDRLKLGDHRHAEAPLDEPLAHLEVAGLHHDMGLDRTGGEVPIELCPQGRRGVEERPDAASCRAPRGGWRARVSERVITVYKSVLRDDSAGE